MARAALLLLTTTILGCSPVTTTDGTSPDRSSRPALRTVTVGGFRIQECSSGKDYPTQGDEAVDVDYGNLSYHARVLHPKVTPGPHFSSPMFWVSEQGGNGPPYHPSFVSLPTSAEGLSWHSLHAGFFFAEEGREESRALRGFLFERGYDNYDSDRSGGGLLVVFEGRKSKIWHWTYRRRRGQQPWQHRLTEPGNDSTTAPSTLVRRLVPVLQHAEKKADGARFE